MSGKVMQKDIKNNGKIGPLTNVASLGHVQESSMNCAIKQDQTAWCWGAFDADGLGLFANGQQVPNVIEPNAIEIRNDHLGWFSPVLKITAGLAYRCLIRDIVRDAWCLGYQNSFGQLGDGSFFTHALFPEPVQPKKNMNLKNLVAIEAGKEHTCAIQDGWTVWCWGSNSWGQLGQDIINPPIKNSPVPLQVQFPVADP